MHVIAKVRIKGSNLLGALKQIRSLLQTEENKSAGLFLINMSGESSLADDLDGGIDGCKNP
jgi:hypothetical protein